MATTDDTWVHQPLYLQQSGVWGINKSPVCREIYNHRLTTQGRARTAAAPQSAQALSSAPTPAFRPPCPPRSRAPLARISRTWRRPSSAPPPCSGPRSARRGAARSASRLREPSLQEPAGASDPVCGLKRRLTHDGASPIARGDRTAAANGLAAEPGPPLPPLHFLFLRRATANRRRQEAGLLRAHAGSRPPRSPMDPKGVYRFQRDDIREALWVTLRRPPGIRASGHETKFKKKPLVRAWWCMSFIPALARQGQVDLGVRRPQGEKIEKGRQSN